MARDYITIGPSPSGEECAQMGAPDYAERARAEIKALRGQMLRILGPLEGSAEMGRKRFSHDFGEYYELAVSYDEDDEEGTAYAYRAEDSLPEYWDAEALAELAEAGFPTTSAAPAAAETTDVQEVSA